MVTQQALRSVALLLCLFLLEGCAGVSSERMSEKKSELRREMQNSIAAIDEQIERLQNYSAEAEEETQEVLRSQLDTLEDVKFELGDKVTELGDTTPEQWKTFQDSATVSLHRARLLLRKLPSG